MKSKWILLLFLAFGCQKYFAQCQNAIIVNQTKTCETEQIQLESTASVIWFRFTAEFSSELFKYELSPDDGTVVSGIQLYSGNCTTLNPVAYYDSLGITDSVTFSNLTASTDYYFRIDLANRKNAINLDYCQTEKAEYDQWHNRFYIHSPSGNMILSDCISGGWPSASQSPTGTQYSGNYGCNTMSICILDTLFIELYDHQNAGGFYPGLINQYFQFANANGASFFLINPTLGAMVFTQVGPVTFYDQPNESWWNASTAIANWPMNYLFEIDVYSTLPPTTGQWLNGNLACVDESVTFEFNGPGTITSATVDGVPISVSSNIFEFFGSQYGVGTHTFTYSVHSNCGDANYTVTFEFVEEGATFSMNSCGLATLTYTNCDPPNNIDYTIDWGDGTTSTAVFTSGTFTVTHVYPPGGPYNWYMSVNYIIGNQLVYEQSGTTSVIQTNQLQITGPLYACELNGQSFTIPNAPAFTSITWTVSPFHPFTGQGTASITPTGTWSTQVDITISFTGQDANGCTYEGEYTLYACCKQTALTNTEFFERSYYTHMGPTGLSLQFPAGSYYSPTTVDINLPDPPTTYIQTPFSTPSTLTALAAANGWDISSGTLIVPNVVYFNNDFIIDVDIQFISCNYFRFAPNAKIVVNPGVDLIVRNSTLAPYCEEMWGGINSTYSDATISVVNSNIIGAINGVYSDAGALVYVTSSKLIDNFNGIRILNDLDASNDLITYNYFGDIPNQPLLFPYNTQQSGDAGVVVSAVTNLKIGNNDYLNNVPTTTGNLFHNIRRGIDGSRSHIKVFRNTFYNMIQSAPDPFLNEGDKYCGVRMTAGKLFGGDLIVGQVDGDKNTFYNCAYGISARNGVNVEARFNMIKRVRLRGINWETNPGSKTFTVTNNQINSVNNNAYGIYAKDYGTSIANIHYNTINSPIGNPLSNLGMVYGLASGIYCSSTLPSGTQTTGIMYNDIRNCLYNIWILNTKNTQVRSNTITLTSNNAAMNALVANYAPIRGIMVQNSPGTALYSNSITRSNGVYGIADLEKLQGIRLEVSPFSYVWKNNMTGVVAGFYSYGSNISSTVQCNTMTSCNYGFYMNQSDISTQGSPTLSAHNRWVAILNEGTEGTVIGHSLSNPLKYYHSPGSIFGSDPTLSIDGPTNFWDDITISSTNNTCGNASLEVPVINESALEKRARELSAIVGMTPLYDALDANAKHFLNIAAYSRLKQNPAELNLGSGDAPYLTYQEVMESAQSSKYERVDHFMSEGEYTSAQAVLETYDPNDAFAQLAKEVSQVWNTSLQTGIPLSVQDSIFLSGVACLDPIENGSAVYIARAILDKDPNCGTASRQAKAMDNSSISEKNIELYPNPNNGNFRVKGVPADAKIEIVNVSGATVFSSTLANAGDVINVSLKDGVYLLRITLLNGEVVSKKMVIYH